MSLLERLESDGPKRILSLDGGGIRGVLTIGFLQKIEQTLRKRHDAPDLLLRDYFDLIGGTSTGAIISAALSLGMDTTKIKNFYLTLGKKVFGKKKFKVWEALFDTRPLREVMDQYFGDRTLSDPSIKTGLCIVTKRADTGSTWPLLNHPKGKFFQENRHIRLSDAVQASAAAPVYFQPKTIDLGGGQVGTFIDGGISMANNPALQLFLVATLEGFPFRWTAGEDSLLLVSVGTGTWYFKSDPERMARRKAWDWAGLLPDMFIRDSNWHDQLMLQYLSRTPTPWTIDMEVGNLQDDLLGLAPALSYLRYDALLEAEALEKLGFPELIDKVESIREMSSTKHIEDLAAIGEKAAEIQINGEHFPSIFDLSQPTGETRKPNPRQQ